MRTQRQIVACYYKWREFLKHLTEELIIWRDNARSEHFFQPPAPAAPDTATLYQLISSFNTNQLEVGFTKLKNFYFDLLHELPTCSEIITLVVLVLIMKENNY